MFRSPKDVTLPRAAKPDTEKKLDLRKIFKTYKCEYCKGGPWATQIDLEIHRKTSHRSRILKLMNDDNSNICILCLKSLNTRELLIEHIKVTHLCCGPNATHIHRDIYICDYCERLFFNKQLLITHIQTRHHITTAAVKQLTCPRCWKKVKNSGYWYHFVSHGLFSVTACPICLENFEHTSDMLEHVKMHSCRFTCNLCGYETLKEVYLRTHLDKHKKTVSADSNEDVSRYFMPYTQRCPNWKQRFISLVKGIPLSDYVKICVLCNRLCSSEEEMREHILGDHAPDKEDIVKRHVCACGEEFFNKVLLKQHVFRLKGNHKELEGASQSPVLTPEEDENKAVIYRIYEFGDSLNETTEIIIPDTTSPTADTESEDVEVETLETRPCLPVSEQKSEDEHVDVMDQS